MGRIVHVDNSGFFRKIMKLFLFELGYEYEGFSRGYDALFTVKNENIASVITGLELPDMKGEEFIRQLYLLQKPLSIIVFSSITSGERLKQLESMGVVGIVEKSSNWKEELRKFFT